MNRTRAVARAAAVTLLIPTVAAGAAAAHAAPPAPAGSPPLSKFTEQLLVPPVIPAPAGALSLREVVTRHAFHADLPATPTFAYTPPGLANTFLGPTIEVSRGTPLSLTMTNELGDGTEVVHPLEPFFDDTLHGHQDAEDAKAVATAAHLHGGHTPPHSDGGPNDTFLPRLDADASTYLKAKARADVAGGTGQYTYEYPNDQEAAGLWIHDHALGATRLNPKAGLALNYWIRDQFDTGRPGNPLGLPTGAYELPIVLQDGSFNADGTFDYPTATTEFHPLWAPESFGDVAIVNGKAWPNKDVDRALYRLRLVNGSNARVYRLSLVDAKDRATSDVRVFQIGGDGGLLDAPVSLTGGTVLLAPGERADLLVDFTQARPGTYRWKNNATTPFPNGPRSARRGGAPLRDIMQFTVGPRVVASGTVLAALRGGPGQPGRVPATSAVAQQRTLMLNEIIDPVTGVPVAAYMDNLPFRSGHGEHAGTGGPTIIANPSLDTAEVWTLVNTTGDAHPIHLHLTQFRVLDRQPFDAGGYLAQVDADLAAAGIAPLSDPAAAGQGTGLTSEVYGDVLTVARDATPYLRGARRAPARTETGWKDTVISYPGEVLRIFVPFGGSVAGLPAPYSGSWDGTYVWHCHILEHEENDMMLSYEVVRRG